jgi:hypothetical protein
MKGQPWSVEEEHRLLSAFEAGYSPADLAEICVRTVPAILTRLMRLERVFRSPVTGRLYKISPEPWV